MVPRLRSIGQDIGSAWLSVRRSPRFAVAIVCSVAIGIGGTLVSLSVLDRLLFRAPPGIAHPGQIRRVLVRERFTRNNAAVLRSSVSFPDLVDIARAVDGRVAGYATTPNRALEGQERSVSLSYVTSGFFDLLGIVPYRGRFFDTEESSGHPLRVEPVVLSYHLWDGAYGRDPDILGKHLKVNGNAFVVVGVGPPGFRGPDLAGVDLWATISSRASASNENWISDRGSRFLSVLARATSGVSLKALGERIRATYASVRADQGWADSSMQVVFAPLLLARGPEPLRPVETRNLSLAKRLAGVSVVVLLTTTLNISILFLMRAVRRRRELAVRLALGASRSQLCVLYLTESLLLALFGGTAASLIAWWGTQLFQTTLLSNVDWAASGLDHRMIFMAVALSAVVGVGASVAPAIFTQRSTMNVLRTEGSSVDAGGSRARFYLLGLQTALCVVLVSFGAAFLQSLRRISAADFGFEPDRLVAVVGRLGYANALRDVVAPIRSLPSVVSISESADDIAPGRMRAAFGLRGGPPLAPDLWPSYSLVGPEFFETAGLRITRGRPFSVADAATTEQVIVVTERAARELWNGRDPLNDCAFVLADFKNCRRVVGIVKDVRWDLSLDPPAHFYVPITQAHVSAARFLYVRLARKPDQQDIAAINHVARLAISSAAARPSVLSTAALLDPQIKPLRAASFLFLAFGALALFSAAAGIYGVVSYDLDQRIRELGVRIALGAESHHVVALVTKRGVKALSLGLMGGLAGVAMFGPIVAAFLFDTSPYDLRILMVVSSTILIVAAAAIGVPVFRALRLDPVIALRID
jgi:predicted permease